MSAILQRIKDLVYIPLAFAAYEAVRHPGATIDLAAGVADGAVEIVEKLTGDGPHGLVPDGPRGPIPDGPHGLVPDSPGRDAFEHEGTSYRMDYRAPDFPEPEL